MTTSIKLTKKERRKLLKRWRKTHACPHCGDVAKSFISMDEPEMVRDVQCMMCGLTLSLLDAKGDA